MISTIGIGDGKSFRLVNSKEFYDQLNTLKGRYDVTVRRARRSKSLPQLGYYYSAILPHFRRAALDAGWEFASLEEVDNYLKLTFAGREIVNTQTAEIMTIPGLKRDMSTTEMTIFVEAIRKHAAEYLNYNIPDPETQAVIEYDQTL